MEHIITRILQATAWPMDPPAPYSPFHLCLLLAGIPLSIFAACAAAGSRKGKMAGKRKTAASWGRSFSFSVVSFSPSARSISSCFYMKS